MKTARVAHHARLTPTEACRLVEAFRKQHPARARHWLELKQQIDPPHFEFFRHQRNHQMGEAVRKALS